jgi:predicted peroxiredoxin
VSEAPKRKLLVVVAEDALSDKATIAFTLANSSLSAGMEVGIFLVSDAVDLARAGAAQNAHFKPFKPLDELFESFLASGGTVFGCGSCWHHRSMGETPVAEGAVLSGIGTAVDWIAVGAQIVSL